jgi:hypothetical protein
MASMTRSELKDIVKECIMEVLLEGLDSAVREKPQPRRQVESQQRSVAPVNRSLDKTFSAGANRIANQAQGRRPPPPAVTELASEFHGEQRDIMQMIFEDTARTTLPSQMTADRSPAAALSAHADALSPTSDIDPMSIFDGASNWAELAFTSKK